MFYLYYYILIIYIILLYIIYIYIYLKASVYLKIGEISVMLEIKKGILKYMRVLRYIRYVMFPLRSRSDFVTNPYNKALH